MEQNDTPSVRKLLSYWPRVAAITWACGQFLVVGGLALTLVEGVLPGATAWVSGRLVDTVSRGLVERRTALFWVGLEALLVVVAAICRKSRQVGQLLLYQRVAFHVSERVLHKAATLELADMESADFHDRLRRARGHGDHSVGMVGDRTMSLFKSVVTLTGYAVLLWQLTPWALVALAAAAWPAFLADNRYSVWGYWSACGATADERLQSYLAQLLISEDAAKEVKLFGLAPWLLRRWRQLRELLMSKQVSHIAERALAGLVLSVLSWGALYGAYAWIVWSTLRGQLTIGDMTMYLLVVRQGHAALSDALGTLSSTYEEALYLSSIFDFLDSPGPDRDHGSATGTDRGDGLRLENVTFTYRGATEPALQNVSLHVPPGRKLALVGENGSGKTTLTKLMAGLYRPDSGRVLLDGLDVEQWDPDALRRRFAVIFQDFMHYQLTIGENIGVGDVAHVDDVDRWQQAAVKGMADGFIEQLPQGYRTSLGTLRHGGRQLSVGQWQKLALARAFMRSEADLLVLDEPTSALDPQAETDIFERMRQLTDKQTALLISHRFSTVRMADEIVVLQAGQIVEQGTHATLLAQGGVYARLFKLQAERYQ